MPDDKNSSISPDACYKLAGVWLLRGKREQAEASLRRALELDGGHLPACFELTSLLLEKGDREAALALCKSVLDFAGEKRSLRERIEEIEKSLSPQNNAPVVAEEHSNLCPEREKEEPARLGLKVLMYSDCGGMDGAEQCSHLIMMDLVAAGFDVVSAQPWASHSLVSIQRESGIRHVWIEQEDGYAAGPLCRTDSDCEKAENLLDDVLPDLVFFSDGAPFSSLPAKRAVRERGIPYLILTHCVDPDWAELLKGRAGDLREAFESAAEVVSVSKVNLDDLRAHFGLPHSKGRVVYNGRPDRFFKRTSSRRRTQMRKELGIGESDVVCVTVARMEIMKGYQYQLSALELLKGSSVWDRLKFVWVGTGTLEGRFQARAAELGIEESIHFLGSRDDVSELLAASDIFVLPSQYEGMPLSVIEAMAAGLPVVASAVSGIPEALGDTGFLVPDPRKKTEESVLEMVATIQKLATRILSGERELGLSGQKRAISLFSARIMLEGYQSLVKSAISNAAATGRVASTANGREK